MVLRSLTLLVLRSCLCDDRRIPKDEPLTAHQIAVRCDMALETVRPALEKFLAAEHLCPEQPEKKLVKGEECRPVYAVDPPPGSSGKPWGAAPWLPLALVGIGGAAALGLACGLALATTPDPIEGDGNGAGATASQRIRHGEVVTSNPAGQAHLTSRMISEDFLQFVEAFPGGLDGPAHPLVLEPDVFHQWEQLLQGLDKGAGSPR